MSDRTSSDAGQVLFTVRDAARIFGLKESRLRYWSQTGFINPRGRKAGRQAYTFSDLVEIKAAHELLAAGIPLQRVRRTLRALRQQMPDERAPLARLRVRSDGDSLVVSDEDATFNPISGQLLLDFELDEIGRCAAQVLEFAEAASRRQSQVAGSQGAPSAAAAMISAADPCESDADASDGAPPQTAYGWFLRGCSLDSELASVPEAIAAYQRAIEIDPSLAAAHTNLGNLHYRLDQPAAALRCYEMACSLDPDLAEARYNLANIYEEEGDLDLAIAEYRQALRIVPDFADGHFNLALTLERVGSQVQAVTHWRRYVELSHDEEDAPWRQLALEHIARLESVVEARGSDE